MLTRKMICGVLTVCFVMFSVRNSIAASKVSEGLWITTGGVVYGILGVPFGWGVTESDKGAIIGGIVGTGIGGFIGSHAPDSVGAKVGIIVPLVLEASVIGLLYYILMTEGGIGNDVEPYFNTETDYHLSSSFEIRSKVTPFKIGHIRTRFNNGRVTLLPPSLSIEDSIQLPNHRTETDYTVRLINMRF